MYLFLLAASLAIVITSSGKNIAGEKYNLTCTVKINGSSDVPNISWNTSVSDEIIFKGNGTYSSVLQFHPLLFFDQGMYKCQAKVADITDIQAYYLTVKGKQSWACIVEISHGDSALFYT